MKEIVLDTNVYISAFAFGGEPRRVINTLIAGKAVNYISDQIIDEMASVLKRPKFGYDDAVIRTIIYEIEQISELFNNFKVLDLVERDIKDNHVLACALYARADYLVTGDNDLLGLEVPGKLKIITPAQFMEII
ncbi:MAG: putative toxin-antitoxin system toxin component, PIN family [Bacillota bacterium]